MPRNAKNAAAEQKCTGDEKSDSETFCIHDVPTYLGPKSTHIGQKKSIPNNTPEMMDMHIMVPKLLRMRILVNAAVGIDARRLVPAALSQALAARSRYHIIIECV